MDMGGPKKCRRTCVLGLIDACLVREGKRKDALVFKRMLGQPGRCKCDYSVIQEIVHIPPIWTTYG